MAEENKKVERGTDGKQPLFEDVAWLSEYFSGPDKGLRWGLLVIGGLSVLVMGLAWWLTGLSWQATLWLGVTAVLCLAAALSSRFTPRQRAVAGLAAAVSLVVFSHRHGPHSVLFSGLPYFDQQGSWFIAHAWIQVMGIALGLWALVAAADLRTSRRRLYQVAASVGFVVALVLGFMPQEIFVVESGFNQTPDCPSGVEVCSNPLSVTPGEGKRSVGWGMRLHWDSGVPVLKSKAILDSTRAQARIAFGSLHTDPRWSPPAAPNQQTPLFKKVDFLWSSFYHWLLPLQIWLVLLGGLVFLVGLVLTWLPGGIAPRWRKTLLWVGLAPGIFASVANGILAGVTVVIVKFTEGVTVPPFMYKAVGMAVFALVGYLLLVFSAYALFDSSDSNSAAPAD